MQNVEVWLIMDENGDYAAGEDRDTTVERFEENVGSAAGARIVKLNVTMAPPKETEVDVKVPDEAGDTVEAAVA